LETIFDQNTINKSY